MKKINEQIGYELSAGFFTKAGQLFLIGLALLGMLNFSVKLFGWGMDSTDASTWSRSSLRPLKDAATGVQYLSDGKGGLTPRLTAEGTLYH